MLNPPVLAREFYQRPTDAVASDLLGKLLVREHTDGEVVVRITEAEAYLGVEDPACHTFGGRRTPRTETMWGPAGRAYVYLVYGLHHCLNAVTVGEGAPEAVLIRGAEVIGGRELVHARRGGAVAPPRWTDGPGKLCQALAITRAQNAVDLCSDRSELRICDDGRNVPDEAIVCGPRIGVDYAGEAASWPLRFRIDPGRSFCGR